MDSSTITEQINQGKRPEPGNEYDRARHESMRLRRNGLYGVPKFQFNPDNVFPGTCLGCIFAREKHTCGK